MTAAGHLSSQHPQYDIAAQREVPYADAVRSHAAKAPQSLMVPGHGSTAGSGRAALEEFFGPQVVSYDVPQLLEGIDLGPDSPHAQSRALAAAAWGADTTWFCTNGASQANRVAALAARGLGTKVIMQRSAHSSFSDGVLLAGLRPYFVLPSIDVRNGVSHGLTPAALEAAFAAAGDGVGAVYVVSPSYFGSTADIPGLAAVAHAHGAALIVDGAWGAHFGFHPELPESPARLGADLVVSSTHKLAGSLTQSAMLHLGKGERADQLRSLVDRAYSMTASTSQSAILQCSLDLARREMATDLAGLDRSVRAAKQFREWVCAHPELKLLEDTFGDFPDIVASDLLRIAVDVSKLQQNGHWVHRYLQEEHGVFCEMATATVVVALIGAGATPDLDRIYAAFDAAVAAAGVRDSAGDAPEFPPLPAPGEMVVSPREAYFGEIETVPAAAAAGRVSVDSLAAYPPGIPNVLPGERITQEIVDFLGAVGTSPAGYVRGALDPAVTQFRVLRQG